MKISKLIEDFLYYCRIDKRLMDTTLEGYRKNFKAFIRDFGDINVEDITLESIIKVRRVFFERKLSDWYENNYFSTLRVFLRWCAEEKKLKVMDCQKVKIPKINFKEKEIIILTNEEVKKFTESINIYDIHGLRFRTVVEFLLGSGLRISETLSINRRDIDWTRRSVEVLGKGRKRALVYFSERANGWLKKYIATRNDDHEALFVTHCAASRLHKNSVAKEFCVRRRKIKMDYKRISAHTLRHTFCTNLLLNGAGMAVISKLARHDDINTTIRFYTHFDTKFLRDNLDKYLDYNKEENVFGPDSLNEEEKIEEKQLKLF